MTHHVILDSQDIKFLDILWNDSRYQLEGSNCIEEGVIGDYTQGIDRDQAVNDHGKAISAKYWLSRESFQGMDIYEFDSQTMEAYAKEW